MYGEFDRGNCALSDIYAAMWNVSLSFGWLAYLEVGGSSWICVREQVGALGGSTFSVNGAPNWWHHHFLANLIENIFSTECEKCIFPKMFITFMNCHKILLVIVAQCYPVQ